MDLPSWSYEPHSFTLIMFLRLPWETFMLQGAQCTGPCERGLIYAPESSVSPQMYNFGCS